jgi:hypothetical protein
LRGLRQVRRWFAITKYGHCGIGIEKLVLYYAFISQETNRSKKDSDLRQVRNEIGSPFQEGLAERGPVVAIGREEWKELARVPNGFFLVGW